MCQFSLTCHDLSLWHPEPWRFVTTRWQYPGRRNYSYICYRLTMAGFFFVWTVIDMATYGPGPHSRWLIHITNWSKLLVMIEVLIQATLACHYHLWKLRKRPPGAPVLHEVSFNALLRVFYGVQWFFTSVSGVFAIVTVSVAFLEEDSSGAFRAARYFTSLLYVLIDHMVHNQPKHMLHVFYALFLHVIYIVFNAVYVMAGGTTPSGSSVIDGIDWSRAETAGFVCLSVLLVFVAHTGLWLLARLREVLYSCVGSDHAIKLPLTGAEAVPYGPTAPYGATRQDPEGGHPSPIITEKQRPEWSPDAASTTSSLSESGHHSPSGHHTAGQGPAGGGHHRPTPDRSAAEADPAYHPAAPPHTPGQSRDLQGSQSPGSHGLRRSQSPGSRDVQSSQPPGSRDVHSGQSPGSRDPAVSR